MKKSINDGTAFSGSSFPLFILSRIGGLEYKEDRCLEGATIFEGEKEETREERKQKEKGRNGHGEAKARNPWMDETMRREEVEGEEESR